MADNKNRKPIAPVNQGRDRTPNYNIKYGTQFRYGLYYAGVNHRQWSTWRYYNSYGTVLYYDPWTREWYYWCAPDLRYYPVSYVPYGIYAW